MTKQSLVQEIVDSLSAELSVLLAAARTAHEAATHEESRAEDQHDTRGIEASYLAEAQAKRAHELQRTIGTLRALEIREFGPSDPVAPGAWVELRSSAGTLSCLLVPQGGGVTLKTGDRSIQLVTPLSPLGEELIGRRPGETFEIEVRGSMRELTLLSIR